MQKNKFLQEQDLNLKIIQVKKYKTKIESMIDTPIPDLQFTDGS
jgi:hypothetical protein